MDLLLSRYHSIDYVMQLDYETGMELINKCQEQKIEEQIFQRWIPYQGQISFEEFKKELGPARVMQDNRSAEEIIESLCDMWG